MPRRRQLSTTVYRIAPRSPASSSPTNSQFFFYGELSIKNNYAEIRIMRSSAAGRADGGIRCSIGRHLRNRGVCARSRWVLANHHDSKTIPSSLRSTPDGCQPSRHNHRAIRPGSAGPGLRCVDLAVLRPSSRALLSLARQTPTPGGGNRRANRPWFHP